MRIHRNLVKEGKPLIFEEDLSFSQGDCAGDYPLLSVPNCRFSCKVENEDGYLTADYSIEGKMELADSRTGKPFLQEFSDADCIDLLESEEEDGEGYIFPGTHLESRDLAHKIIHSLIPISPHQEGSSLPKSGEGYSFLKEEDEH